LSRAAPLRSLHETEFRGEKRRLKKFSRAAPLRLLHVPDRSLEKIKAAGCSSFTIKEIFSG
jgi:hypothetical protein